MENEAMTREGDESKALVKRIIAVAAVLVAAAVLFACLNAVRAGGETDPSAVQGSVKMTEIDLNSMLDGYVDEVLVAEGDHVAKDQVLVRMDADVVQAKVQEAEAARAAAAAVLAKAQNGARSEDITQAKAQYDYAAKSYERMKNLLADGAISQNSFDEIEAKYLAAKALYDEAVSGARSEDIAAAEAQLMQAEGAVAEATTYLEHTVITAPADGTVTAINVEPGELVSTGMALASLRSDDAAWLEVNVPETMLGSVIEGQRVEFTLPAYAGQTFTGHVKTVSKNPDFATKKATNENGSFDVLSYCVKIEPDDMEEQLYAGMTVLVNFNAGDEQ